MINVIGTKMDKILTREYDVILIELLWDLNDKEYHMKKPFSLSVQKTHCHPEHLERASLTKYCHVCDSIPSAGIPSKD
jgi:hypothetical protein